MRFFNKLERRFGRYAIHNLMYYIIIMYVMGFVMMYMDPMFFTRYLSLDAEAILHGQVWRLVTFLLYPPTLSPFWIIFAALMYYSLGRSLEAVWGAFRFNVFFFMGAIGIILAEFIVYFIIAKPSFILNTEMYRVQLVFRLVTKLVFRFAIGFYIGRRDRLLCWRYNI